MTITYLNGDCRQVLKTLASNSVNCCVTSPPYFGLRDYENDAQLGDESTPDEFVQNLVGVFREVRRVLRDDGTLWLNLGDSYAGSGKGQTQNGTADPKNKKTFGTKLKTVTARSIGLKPKDLIGIPWKVAFALQADGWWLRQDIIWSKVNSPTESVLDRCTKSHEYIFLLSKSQQYYYDAESIKEEAVTGGKRNKRSVWHVQSKPFKGEHPAMFPPDLIKPCILAGCPKDGVVLDVFGGAGTTGLVCNENERNAILIELNPKYMDIAKDRLTNNLHLFMD